MMIIIKRVKDLSWGRAQETCERGVVTKKREGDREKEKKKGTFITERQQQRHILKNHLVGKLISFREGMENLHQEVWFWILLACDEKDIDVESIIQIE